MLKGFFGCDIAPKLSACNVFTEIMGISAPYAIPLAVETPMRSPVYEPGPLLTETASRSAGLRLFFFRISSINTAKRHETFPDRFPLYQSNDVPKKGQPSIYELLSLCLKSWIIYKKYLYKVYFSLNNSFLVTILIIELSASFLEIALYGAVTISSSRDNPEVISI